jgi:hypothetical protein
MGKKKVLVSYGVDIDAVAGWLGSYGGEDSTSDISRGDRYDDFSHENMFLTPVRTLGGDCRHPATAETIRKIRHQSHVVYPR